MAKKVKKVKRTKKVRVLKFKGLKNYIILGLIGIVGIGVTFAAIALNAAFKNLNEPTVDVVNLPDTGATTYYTRCYIDNEDGIGNYVYQSAVECEYLGETEDGYDFETSQMYLFCQPNDIVEANICTEGIVK